MSPGAATLSLYIVNSLGFIALLSPLFLVFEIWQLVMSERYVGIKQIARGSNPREIGMATQIVMDHTGDTRHNFDASDTEALS